MSPVSRKRIGVHNLLLGALCVGAIVAAALIVGAPSSPRAQMRLASVQQGVVQSTVSGSGNLQAASQANLNFKTSGVLAHLYVHAGQQVRAGQLLADLDPSSAQVNVEQAQANLDSANAKLAQVEANPSSASTSAANGQSQASTANASTASFRHVAEGRFAAGATGASMQGPTGASGPTAKTEPSKRSQSGSRSSSGTTTTAAPRASTPGGSGATGSPATTMSPATAAANLASAQAAVAGAKLTVQSAQQALNNTRLYAPQAGTVASVSGQPGDEEGPGQNSSSQSSSSSSTSAQSGGGGQGAGSSSGGSGSSGQGANGNSGSSAFIVLTNLAAMQLVVPFSESDISKIKIGRPATVTVNALPNQEFAGTVRSIAVLSTTNSGVVSYDVTIDLDQTAALLRPGMTASAQIVSSQATNAVNVTSSAISRRGGTATVTVVRHGKLVTQPVITGVVGDTTTEIVAGLTPGEEVAVPVATGLGSSATTSTPGSGRFGGGGLGGGPFGGGGVIRFGGGG
jgi:multidrug efflux pump subunit AcrA (membrane-fusion protein)